MLLAQNMCLQYIKTVLEVCMQCLRTEGPFNTFQMQDSPSVVLRGTRLWSKPEDLSLQSPCSSQNAMTMEHLPRSVSDHLRLFPPLLNLSRFSFLFPLVSCVHPSSDHPKIELFLHWQKGPPPVLYLHSHVFYLFHVSCLCRSSAILWPVTAGVLPVMASQWVAPLCTTGPQCVQVLNRGESSW